MTKHRHNRTSIIPEINGRNVKFFVSIENVGSSKGNEILPSLEVTMDISIQFLVICAFLMFILFNTTDNCIIFFL